MLSPSFRSPSTLDARTRSRCPPPVCTSDSTAPVSSMMPVNISHHVPHYHYVVSNPLPLHVPQGSGRLHRGYPLPSKGPGRLSAPHQFWGNERHDLVDQPQVEERSQQLASSLHQQGCDSPLRGKGSQRRFKVHPVRPLRDCDDGVAHRLDALQAALICPRPHEQGSSAGEAPAHT